MGNRLRPNHEYLLRFAAGAGGPVLDYGCGAGEVVVAGRNRGIDICGADVFYSGGSQREAVAEAGLLGTAVFEIRDDRLPFDASRFAMVLSNQVFEHVSDLDAVLSEVDRVLKPGGTLVSLFPSSDVWREGHLGIPFVHKFDRRSSLRYPYALALRRLGLGANKGRKPPAVWTDDGLEWLDRYCYYRSLAEIQRLLGQRFAVSFIEDDYLAFRVANSRLHGARPLTRISAVSRFVVRKLAGLVIAATKDAEVARRSDARIPAVSMVAGQAPGDPSDRTARPS